MAPDCVGGLEKPRLPCCMMVMATVGMGFDDEVPCICPVVREPAFLATGLNIYDIFSLYPVCQGVLPVGPDTPDPCKGWASLLYMPLSFVRLLASSFGLPINSWGLWRRPNCSRKPFLFQDSRGNNKMLLAV